MLKTFFADDSQQKYIFHRVKAQSFLLLCNHSDVCDDGTVLVVLLHDVQNPTPALHVKCVGVHSMKTAMWEIDSNANESHAAIDFKRELALAS